MKRRNIVLASLALGGLPFPAWTQQPGKVWRIGVLSLSVPPEPRMLARIAQMLAPFGYEVGRNLVIDYKFAQDKKGQLPAMAAELLAAKPDLLIGLVNDEIIALKRATATIPIVMMWVIAPVETGLIASLARPGSNLTGTTFSMFESAGKILQIFKEAIPSMVRITQLDDPDFPGFNEFTKVTLRVANIIGAKVTRVAVRTEADLDAALNAMDRDSPDGILAAMTGAMGLHRKRIIDYAARHRIPVHYGVRQPVVEGGLMSYAPDFKVMAARNAWQIDKILKGAKPNDIPVEEPSHYQLTINMKTARAMGLVIPQTVLLQATEVIE